MARSTALLVAEYPSFTQLHGVALKPLTQVIRANDVPLDVKVSMLEALAPALKNRSVLAFDVGRFLAKLELPKARRFALMNRIVGYCGDHPQCRDALWASLRDAAPDLGQARFEKESRTFLARFGKDSISGREAQKALLRSATGVADPARSAELKQLEAEDAVASGMIATAFSAAERHLANSDGRQAARALEEVEKSVPSYASQEAWCRLLENPLMGTLPAEQSLPVLAVLAEHAPEGRALDLGARLVRGLVSSRERTRLLLRLVARNATDRERSRLLSETAIRAAEGTDDAAIQLEAYRVAAAAARRLDSVDLLVRALNGLGKAGWDLSPSEARVALREAATHYPEIAESAEAGWLLALLEGKLQIAQGPLTRPAQADVRVSQPPLVSLPAPPLANETTRVAAGGVTLAAQASNSDFLNGRTPRASTAQDTASLAFDGKANTAWQPKQLPASLLVPLARRGSIAALRVGAADPVYFQASVLDCNGVTLARVERDWSFDDAYRAPNYWPAADETFKVLPVAEACFVRVDVFASASGSARIHTVEAYPSGVRVEGVHLAEPVPLGSARAIRVGFRVDEPHQQVSYDASGEWSRGYPIVRWGDFWSRRAKPTKLKAGSALGISFFGTNATLVLDGPGAVGFQVDDGPEALLPHPQDAQTEHPLVSELRSGLHVLKLWASSLPRVPEQDSPAPDAIRFVRVAVDGVSRARVAVRFGRSKQEWGAWSAPLVAPGGGVPVPAEVAGGRPTFAQAAAFFDAREVRGEAGATLQALDVEPLGERTQDARFTRWPDKDRLNEELSLVSEALGKRTVVVTYPKTGTVSEYEAARRLAQKANVYLSSDDIALNFYGGTILAVGTPLRSRYARQLLASDGLWNAPGFFADGDGVVAAIRDHTQKPFYFAVTGDTPIATVRAADRLLATLPPPRPAKLPIRVVGSSTLEELNPWQLHTDRSPLARLELRMARNDRRSSVFALAADKTTAKVTVSVSEPTSSTGRKLNKPIIRPVGFYEWPPFFGDLRLPNLLLDEQTFAMPANTTRGVWVTAITPEDASPGDYAAEVTIDADGHIERFPLIVRVEPIALPRQTRTGTFSFEYPPHWFHPGGPHYDTALRAIAADEAAHGVTHVGPALLFDWTVAPQVCPTRSAQGPKDTRPSSIAWGSYTDDAKAIEAGNALFLRLPAQVSGRDLLAGVKGSADVKIVLAYWNGQAWIPLPAQSLRGGAMASALRFSTGAKVEFLRVSAEQTAPISVEKVAAFTGQGLPVQFDFSPLNREMQIYEEEYRKLGLAPRFIVQNSRSLNLVAAEFSGVENFNYGGIGSIFGSALHTFLERSGRLEQTLIKIDDEPKDIAQWADRARSFRNAGLRTMTCHSGDKPSLNAAVGVMNPWCPNFTTNVFQPFFKERKSAGDQLWWYTYGPPNLRLTGRAVDNLAFHWLTARYGFDGEMSYAALHATKTSMPVPFRYENGESHRVVFLPDGTLLDTPRRELEGEGISDIKLTEFVRQRAAELAKAAPAQSRAIELELRALMLSIVPDRYGYSLNPKDWESARSKLYDLALRAAKASARSNLH